MFRFLIFFIIDVIITYDFILLVYDSKPCQKLSNYTITLGDSPFTYNGSYICLKEASKGNYGNWNYSIKDNSTTYNLTVHYIEEPSIQMKSTDPVIIICNENSQFSDKIGGQTEILLEYLYTPISSISYKNYYSISNSAPVILPTNQTDNTLITRTKLMTKFTIQSCPCSNFSIEIVSEYSANNIIYQINKTISINLLVYSISNYCTEKQNFLSTLSSSYLFPTEIKKINFTFNLNQNNLTAINTRVKITSVDKNNQNIILFSLSNEEQGTFVFNENFYHSELVEVTNKVDFLNKSNIVIGSCQFVLKIDSITQQLFKGNENSFNLDDFYCIVNQNYILQFDSILNSGIKDYYKYEIIKKISYEDKTNIITTNSSLKEINWLCQLIKNDKSNILYPKETSELTLIGTHITSQKSIELLTFAIKPIVPIEIGNLSYNISNLKAHKQYSFDIPLIKCVNDNCIPYYRNLKVSFLNTSDVDNSNITLNFVPNNFLRLNILYTGSEDKDINITLSVIETINEIPNQTYNVSVEKNFSFTFQSMILPSFTLKGNDLKTFKEYEDFLITNQDNILYTPFQTNLYIFINDSDAQDNVIKPSISEFVNSVRIFNQPSDMKIEQDGNYSFKISYPFNLTSNLTILILIQNKEQIGVYIPLTIIPYYDYVFTTIAQSFDQSSSYVEELIPSNIPNDQISSLNYLIKIENAYKNIYPDTSQIIEDTNSYHIENDSQTFYFSPNLTVDAAMSCKIYFIYQFLYRSI